MVDEANWFLIIIIIIFFLIIIIIKDSRTSLMIHDKA